jgi:hypothetical protein
LGINILSWETFGAQGVNEGGHEAQAGPILDRATRCRLALEHLMSSIFILELSAWPKNAYIKTPPPQGVPLREAAQKHEREK